MDEVCIFKHVLEVLETHDHPVVLLGVMASRWMGCEGAPDAGTDLLIRNAQLSSIVEAIAKGGDWILLDKETDLRMAFDDPYGILHDADFSLERSNTNSSTNEYHHNFLRLWSEETYHINIDECDLIEVPDIYAWRKFLVEDIYHPCHDRKDGWFYGPRPPRHSQAATSSVLPRGNSVTKPSRIFVPTIPKFLDALVYHKITYMDSRRYLTRISDWLVYLLIRYLYLELPHQALIISFEVEGYTDDHLQPLFESYSRKPFYVFSREQMRAVKCKVHEPETWPQDVREACLPGWCRK